MRAGVRPVTRTPCASQTTNARGAAFVADLQEACVDKFYVENL